MKPIKPGTVKARGRRYLVGAIMRFVDAFEPEILLLPEMKSTGVRSRSDYVADAVDIVIRVARERGISVQTLGHRQVMAALAGKGKTVLRNRHELNEAVVERFPELGAFVPKVRRLYDPEQYFTPMFHAVAMYCAWRHMT